MFTEEDFEGELPGVGFFEATVSIEWTYSDQGIGHYEYWGSTGFHEDWCWELEGFYIEYFTVFDHDHNTILDNIKHTPETRADNLIVFNKIEEEVESIVDDQEPPNDPPED